MTGQIEGPPSYWYSDNVEDARGARVMQALRAYRAAEMSMRRRTQTSMAMSENELLVLRFLTRRALHHVDVTPVEVAKYVGVSTASMTALLDRLEKTGHLERMPHPRDRRKILVAATPHAEDDMRQILGMMHSQMMSATHGMTEEEAVAVTEFLERMRAAVDAVDGEPDQTHAATATPDVAA